MTRSDSDASATADQGAAGRTKAPPSRWGLWIPFVVLALAAGGWVGIWKTAEARAHLALDRFIGDRRAEGLDASFVSAKAIGFPLNFAFDVKGLSMAEKVARPRSVRFETLRLAVLPYAPNHLILQVPDPIEFTFGDGAKWHLTHTSLQGSVKWTDKGLTRLVVEAENLRWTDDHDRMGMLAGLNFVAEPLPPGNELRLDNAIVFQGEARSASIPGLPKELVGLVGNTFGVLRLQGVLKAADRLPEISSKTLADWRTHDGGVVVNTFAADWGPLKASGRGTLGLNAAHRPVGNIELGVGNTSALVENMIARQMIQGPLAELMRKQALKADRDKGGLTTSIQIRDGVVTVFNIRAGQLPSILPPKPDVPPAR